MRIRIRALAVILAVGMLMTTSISAGAEEAPKNPQEITPWAYSALADIYALGMWSDDYIYDILNPVTEAQLTKITDVTAAKLALLKLPERKTDAPALVLDGTRGAVMNALYLEAADYDLPGVELGSVAFLAHLGVIQGEPAASRICTLQEALVMAQRFILAVYDSQDAGSKGLLWKAVSGENTLYLLGTIHVDRGNIYPFHKSLRDALTESQTVIFEVDFSDEADIELFSAMQFYTDGTTLKDHVSADVYTRALKAGEELGLTEAQTSSIKPWALANTLQSASLSGGTDAEAGGSGAETPMVLDTYVNSAAQNLGHEITAVETCVFQGKIFDGLSAEYQESFLDEMLRAYYDADSTENGSAAAQVDAMLDAWKDRDAAGFGKVYDKEAMLKSGDELTVRLFIDRDPGMIASAEDYLKQTGSNTGIMVVGAGHMVGDSGVVQGLKDMGYTVELVPG